MSSPTDPQYPRRVFITGASTGLGAGLARHYGGPGTVLGLVARRSRELNIVADELRSRGSEVHVYTQDVSDTAAMKDVVDHYLTDAGGADLVIANAGVAVRNAMLEGEVDEVAWMMGVNILGVANTVIPFIPRMVSQRGGVLIAMASVAGHRALPGRTAYCASKAAVISLMNGLRLDLRGTGVHAMAICPGFVATPLTADVSGKWFEIDVSTAVRSIVRAIERRRRTFTFPLPVNLFRFLVTRLPEGCLRWVSPPPRTHTSGRFADVRD